VTLADTVRDAVATINVAVDALQAQVTLAPWLEDDLRGKPEYGSPVSYKALVDKRSQMIRNDQGEQVESNAYIVFLQPITISKRDLLTLPDGTTGPILKIGGLIDPDTSAPYMAEVWLGGAA
jgi:hypothetical protein